MLCGAQTSVQVHSYTELRAHTTASRNSAAEASSASPHSISDGAFDESSRYDGGMHDDGRDLQDPFQLRADSLGTRTFADRCPSDTTNALTSPIMTINGGISGDTGSMAQTSRGIEDGMRALLEATRLEELRRNQTSSQPLRVGFSEHLSSNTNQASNWTGEGSEALLAPSDLPTSPQSQITWVTGTSSLPVVMING